MRRIPPSCKPILVVFCLLPLFFETSVAHVNAQEIATNLLPDAPAAQRHDVHAVFNGVTAPRNKPSRRLLTRISVAVLFTGEALDSWTTYKNLTHPKWICGYSPALGNAITYISDDGKGYDPHTIQYDLCSPGPSGQLANYAYDVTRTGAFTETGWASNYHLAGSRNVPAVLAWNIADDAGQMLAAHYLGKRRDMLGRFAPAINLARGAVHLQCGILNLQFARTHNNPGRWQFKVPNESTMFPDPRWWGRQ